MHIEYSMSHPKAFWEKWKIFNETETTAKRPNIKGEDWYDHFLKPTL